MFVDQSFSHHDPMVSQAPSIEHIPHDKGRRIRSLRCFALLLCLLIGVLCLTSFAQRAHADIWTDDDAGITYIYEIRDGGAIVTGITSDTATSATVPAQIAGSPVQRILELGDIGSITSLDVSACSGLTALECNEQGLVSLDVSGCSNLESLGCQGNALTSLDLTGCAKLKTIEASENDFTQINLSKCPSITTAAFNNCSIRILTLSGCSKLADLECSGNSIVSLDLSSCTALTDLVCNDNKITALNLAACSQLNVLQCASNQLTALDISKNTKLTSLDCQNNKIANTSALKTWLAQSGHTGTIEPQDASQSSSGSSSSTGSSSSSS